MLRRLLQVHYNSFVNVLIGGWLLILLRRQRSNLFLISGFETEDKVLESKTMKLSLEDTQVYDVMLLLKFFKKFKAMPILNSQVWYLHLKFWFLNLLVHTTEECCIINNKSNALVSIQIFCVFTSVF